MMDSSRFVSKASGPDAIKLLSAGNIADIIEELAALRCSKTAEYDSESIDNAIRLCEKMDICFEKLDDDEKLLILQTYEIFGSPYNFTQFIKLFFGGGLSSKEAVLRALVSKLKATQSVIECVLSAKTLFASEGEEEQVTAKLNNFLNAMTSAFVQMVPEYYQREAEPSGKNLAWLKTLFANYKPLYRDEIMPYSVLLRNYTDLLYTIFSHELLPYYLDWKDRYLRFWLVEILRKEDRYATAPIPSLSKLKADIYVDYGQWTNIPKRLNANLRDRDWFDKPATLKAEESMLQKLPSNVIMEMVLKIRNTMNLGHANEVDLGFDDAYLDEKNSMSDVINALENEFDGISGFFKEMFENIKKMFTPKVKVEKEPDDKVVLLPRKFPQTKPSLLKITPATFAANFPKAYTQAVPKAFNVFFGSHRKTYYLSFESFVQDLLKLEEDLDFAAINMVSRAMSIKNAKQGIEFSERSVAYVLDEQHILLLGTSYFEMTQDEFEAHSEPRGYFLLLEKVNGPQPDREVQKTEDKRLFAAVSLEKLAEKRRFILDWLQRLIDAMPDDVRAHNANMRLYKFVNLPDK